MAKQKTDTTGTVKALGPTQRAMRYYLEDHQRIIDLRKAIEGVSDDTTLDLIRKAVNLGLPLLEAKWAPIVKANKKQDEQGQS